MLQPNLEGAAAGLVMAAAGSSVAPEVERIGFYYVVMANLGSPEGAIVLSEEDRAKLVAPGRGGNASASDTGADCVGGRRGATSG